MITVIVVGLVVLVVIAVVVGVVDATQAPAWRRIARERRAAWEARRPVHHGIDDGPDPATDD